MRDGAAIVRAEMRRATPEKPRKGEARHEHVRRLLTTHLWHDASDHELAEATGATPAFIRRVRRELERDHQLGRVLTRAAHARDALGYESIYDLLNDALDAFAGGPERHGEATQRRAAAPGHPKGESRQSGPDPRERARTLLAASRALRKLRAADQAQSGRGGSRTSAESAAHRETAAGERRRSVAIVGG